MKDRAYAKINLSLDVFNVRDDGYHDLKSIMIPLNFYDELEIVKASEDSFECNRSYIGLNEHNSIYKMINIIRDRYNIEDKFLIKLNKIIPTQAGLGGGTADGASALRIMKKLYNLEMSDEEIVDICLKVGADVPFNYYNVPALVSGIGDKIEPIKMHKRYHVLLVKPHRGIATAKAYELLDMNICDHPDIDRLKEVLEKGESFDGMLGNSLEQPSVILNEEIKVIKDKMIEYGGKNVLMSGSGSTVFCIEEDKEIIDRLYRQFINNGYYVRFTKTRGIR